MTEAPGARPSAVLMAAIRNAALAMAAPHGRRLAQVLASHPSHSPRAYADAVSVAPVPQYRRAAAGVLDTWALEPAVSGLLVATALAAAIDTADAVRATQSIDVVWTGPSSAEVPVRLTREVLLEVIAGATSSLIIVSYAAYNVPDIVHALAAAAQRGVDVRLVLESAEGAGGRLSVDAAVAFRSLRGSVGFYEWSPDDRSPVRGRIGSMHAKAAIADEQVAFVTSANLTGSAIEGNMELGVLIRGGPVPRRLVRHFLMLFASDHLVQVAPAES